MKNRPSPPLSFLSLRLRRSRNGKKASFCSVSPSTTAVGVVPASEDGMGNAVLYVLRRRTFLRRRRIHKFCISSLGGGRGGGGGGVFSPTLAARKGEAKATVENCGLPSPLFRPRTFGGLWREGREDISLGILAQVGLVVGSGRKTLFGLFLLLLDLPEQSPSQSLL